MPDGDSVNIESLTPEQIDLLGRCGKDAAEHPLVIDDGVLRFKSNPVIRIIVDRWVNLNDLWRDIPKTPEFVLGLRSLYRDLGYSLCGYLDMFGEWEPTGKRVKGDTCNLTPR